MRAPIAAIATILCLPTLSLPAAAQVNPQTGARPGHIPGEGLSYPLSPNASNIDGADIRSTVAPTLPEPSVGENATPQQLLVAARAALAAGRTGEVRAPITDTGEMRSDLSQPGVGLDVRPSDFMFAGQIP